MWSARQTFYSGEVDSRCPGHQRLQSITPPAYTIVRLSFLSFVTRNISNRHAGFFIWLTGTSTIASPGAFFHGIRRTSMAAMTGTRTHQMLLSVHYAAIGRTYRTAPRCFLW